MSNRITITLDDNLLERIDKIAESTSKSESGMICSLVKDALGYVGSFPVIIKSGNSFMWFSPLGKYGNMNKKLYKRFLGGGIPLTEGNLWTEAFDEMQDAAEAFGTIVCRQSTRGLIVEDIESFLTFVEKFS